MSSFSWCSGASEKTSDCRRNLVNWHNHGAKIDRAWMQHAIQISEPGLLLLREWRKLKKGLDASVCFDKLTVCFDASVCFDNRNCIYVANDRVMLEVFCNVPSRTLSEPCIFRKPSMATCPAGTMIVQCSLHAYEKMLDLSSVWCSFGLQSFNIFVKRTGSHSVPAITVSNHHAPTITSRQVSSTRESNVTTESPIDRLCKKQGQGQCKIAWWVSCL